MNSNNQILKVVFAIFAGAFIGSLVGLHYGKSVISLIVGCVVGAIVGHVSYEPKTVLKAFTQVVSEASVFCLGWRKTKLRLWIFWRTFANFFVAAISAFWPMLWLNTTKVPYGYDLSFSLTFTSSIIMFLPLGFACLSIAESFSGEEGLKKMIRICRYDDTTNMFKYTNPVCLPFFLCYWIVCGSVFLVRLLFKASLFLKYLPALTVKFFKLIHCEARVQTATYAVIGTTIGWWVESPLIGASVGAVLGALGYQFVSKKFVEANV